MSERTEPPTPRRLEEARKQGMAPRSLELNAAAGLLISALLLQGPGKEMLSALQGSLAESISSFSKASVTPEWLKGQAVQQAMPLLLPFATFAGALLICGVVVTEVQTRFLITPKRLLPDFQRVNPAQGIKRIFSTQGLMELLRAVLKLAIVGWVTYSYLQGHIDQFALLLQTDLLTSWDQMLSLMSGLALQVAGAYFVVAIADFAYQYSRYRNSLRMTRQEVKEDLRRSEGDPFIRSRIRSQQNRLARVRMMAGVPKANVVVTNPTHLAVALEYDNQKMRAPRVVAKGAYRIAERIIAIASEHRIAIVQNVPLAHALYDGVELGQEIPPELYTAMAEVLAYVYRIYGKVPADQPA